MEPEASFIVTSGECEASFCVEESTSDDDLSAAAMLSRLSTGKVGGGIAVAGACGFSEVGVLREPLRFK